MELVEYYLDRMRLEADNREFHEAGGLFGFAAIAQSVCSHGIIRRSVR